jgi:hypothetical protein
LRGCRERPRRRRPLSARIHRLGGAASKDHLPLPCKGTLWRQDSTAQACGGCQILIGCCARNLSRLR